MSGPQRQRRWIATHPSAHVARCGLPASLAKHPKTAYACKIDRGSMRGMSTRVVCEPYTLVVTSCGRFDLLEQTLRSFWAHADIAPEELIVVEDSTDTHVHKVLDGLDLRARILVNETRLGQMRSIDRAYAEVRTPLIFHCEDDWLFTRGGFIESSATILASQHDVSMVGLRPRAELNPLVRASPVQRVGEVEYFRTDPKLHPEYFSYSFNPGLRRLSDYVRLGPYGRLEGEEIVSYTFKKAGFCMANLEAPAVSHIGYGRHIDDPTRSPRARTRVQRLVRSVRKRVKRLRRAIGSWPWAQEGALLKGPEGASKPSV